MRNVILVALLAFAAVIAGGYSIAWFSQASRIKHSIEQLAGRADAPYTFTYDAIETSGFPSKLDITIVRPHFKGHIDTLLKSLDPVKFAALPEWTEEWHQGNITLSTNALSTHYRLRLDGDWQGSGLLKGYVISTLVKPAGAFALDLRLDPHGFGALWNAGSQRWDDAMKNFRSIDVVLPAYVMTEQSSGQVLAQSGPGRLYITRGGKGGREQLRIYIKSTDSEITPRGDELVTTYRQALDPGDLLPSRLSYYGKQNVEFDFSYDGPADFPKEGLGMTPLSATLSVFDVHNTVYTLGGNMHLTNSGTGNRRNAHLDFRLESAFAEPYDALTQDMLRSFIHRMYTDKANPRIAAFKPQIERYTESEMLSILYPALPHFHALGKLVQALDVTMQGNSALTQGDITLPMIELSATPYGLTGTGTAKLAEGSPIPQANVTLACRNCPQMVDDIMGYKSRLQTVVAYFNPDEAALLASDARLADGIKRFLTAIATPEGDTYRYAIASDGAMGISLNGKPMEEIMALYAQYVTPYLRKPEQPQVTPLTRPR